MNVYSQSAFTLIELLVTMTIIGVLAAIAVPQYQSFKARGFDSRALSDLRNVAIAEEAYFLDTESYLPCKESECTLLPGVSSLSKGVSLEIAVGETGFTGNATHEKGTGRSYLWDSEKGGLQE